MDDDTSLDDITLTPEGIVVLKRIVSNFESGMSVEDIGVAEDLSVEQVQVMVAIGTLTGVLA